MCGTQDVKLIEETFEYLLTNVRDQDVLYFFIGMQENIAARRLLAQFFKDKYDIVRFIIWGRFKVQTPNGCCRYTNALRAISRCRYLSRLAACYERTLGI
jgi:hypothetical protein